MFDNSRKLKRNDIIEKINELGWDRDKFIIIGGSALVMSEVIENTNDINMVITKDLYDSLNPESGWDLYLREIEVKVSGCFVVSYHDFDDVYRVCYKYIDNPELIPFNTMNMLDAIRMKEFDLNNMLRQLMYDLKLKDLSMPMIYDRLDAYQRKSNILAEARNKYFHDMQNIITNHEEKYEALHDSLKEAAKIIKGINDKIDILMDKKEKQ